ncbi:CST complex subunit CTC1 isoform X2 [Sarcophilus harrisii]|uniref:CST complex subunit CTC1 isoform X2 n=1 Tax=Sarcophilus harrisii TaxID=9305 RepID=UPI001301A249|nr:CST complex subunit CTC1 isoform X2 [Sarcophilus harrisii]
MVASLPFLLADGTSPLPPPSFWFFAIIRRDVVNAFVHEQAWLQAVHSFIQKNLIPIIKHPCIQLVETVVDCVKAIWASSGATGGLNLPLSYSFVSVQELKSHQHLPCCSHLAWSSTEYQTWANKIGVNTIPLPRERLLLLGILTDLPVDLDPECRDGSLYVKDNSGTLGCELLDLDISWLGHLFLFPSWSYIPPAWQQGSLGSGHLELWCPPVPVLPLVLNRGPETPIRVLYPEIASQLLQHRSKFRRQQLHLAGQLIRLSTLIKTHGKTYFILSLGESSSASTSVPIIVQIPRQLVWHHVLRPGCSYVLTNLQISVIRGYSHRIWATSPSSNLMPLDAEHIQEFNVEALISEAVPNPLPASGSFQQHCNSVPKVRMLTYKGTVTKVLNGPAGLYELDGQLCLCLAYQQLPNNGRTIRPGVQLELLDVHFFHSVDGTPVLAPCLRGTVLLRGFSQQESPKQSPHSFCGIVVHLRLLLERHLGLPLYLWTVKALEEITSKLCPRLLRHRQLLQSSASGTAGVGELLLTPTLDAVAPPGISIRNVYQEILEDPHHCALREYSQLQPLCSFPTLAALKEDGQHRAWAVFDPMTLLPLPEVTYLPSCVLNSRLSWSWICLSSSIFQPPPVLLGVLVASSHRGWLQLRDQSGSLPCLPLPKSSQVFIDPRLIGSLVRVERFQLVVEREVKSNFPSWKELGMPGFIQERRTNIYVLFYLDDALILPIPSPYNLTRRPPQAKFPCLEEPSKVQSRLLLLSHKECLMKRNYQSSQSDGPLPPKHTLSFHVSGTWLGGIQRKDGDGWGLPESLGDESQDQKVFLLFFGQSIRWFEFLHPGQQYRLILPNSAPPSLLEEGDSSPLSQRILELTGYTSCLIVQDDWILEPGNTQDIPGMVGISKGLSESSLTEILSGSSPGSFVSFSAEILSRTPCVPLTETTQQGNFQTFQRGVKLTVALDAAELASRIPIDVYIEAPHPPLPLGLLPGTRVYFQQLERKVSRFQNVYCRFLPSSYLRILCFPAEIPASSNLPHVYLAELQRDSPGPTWASASCHVVSVLSVQLFWLCAHCTSVCVQGQCSRQGLPCPTQASVSQANIRLLVEDGTGEAVVTCTNQQVAVALGLCPAEWDTLMELVRVPGRVALHISRPGAQPEFIGETDGSLMLFLQTLCTSSRVLRPIHLSFELERKPTRVTTSEPPRLHRFQFGEIPVLTHMVPRLSLSCLSLRDPEVPHILSS